MSHVLADMSEGADVESEHRDQTPTESDFCLTTIRSRVRWAKVLFWKSYSSERCYLLIFPKTTFEKLVGLISKLRWNESIQELNEKHLCWTYFWVFVLIGGLDRKQEVAGYLVVSILSIQCVCFYGITKYFPIYVNTFWFWRSSGYEQFELTANRKLT